MTVDLLGNSRFVLDMSFEIIFSNIVFLSSKSCIWPMCVYNILYTWNLNTQKEEDSNSKSGLW